MVGILIFLRLVVIGCFWSCEAFGTFDVRLLGGGGNFFFVAISVPGLVILYLGVLVVGVH